MFELDGLKAVITGSTRGIGRAIAKMLHAQGAEVVITGTNVESLEELAAELKERVHAIPCNLSDAESIQNLAKEAEDKLGQVDILVNNAGITRDNLMMRLKDEDWDDVINVNLSSAFKLTRALLRGMMKRRFGRIINLTSVVGVTGNPGQANYCAAKAGVIGFSKSLAQEVGSRGITVNCIAPGFIATDMTAKLTDAQKEMIIQNVPSRAMGKTDDIAHCALFLASKESNYITGQTIHVNGGLAMI
jgi:3-oxoacyl-[acyl-carrier protein] reductase